MNLRLLGVLIGAAVLGACTQAQINPGKISGALPLCYGPGPDASLAPTTEVKVYRGGHLVASQAFESDTQRRKYDFTLPPGSYVLKTNGQSTAARVKSGSVTSAEFPQLNCL